MLRDQFFYIDRGTETVNARIMHRGVATQPPPSSDHIGTVSQNGILDRYSKTDAIKEDADSSSGSASNAVYSDQMKSSIRLMERIVNLNLDSEAYEDFRFFVDEADKFKEGGSMLPLWRFTSDKAKKKQVTCIKWNPRYSDLFAVGYGSYEFLKQSTGGLVGIFSLKNSKFPDLALATDSTVCSLDWHPLNPALIALGCNKPVHLEDYEALGTAPGYCHHCHTGRCPVGVTTQDPKLQERLTADHGARLLRNYLSVMTLELQTMARACGKNHVLNLEPEDLVALTVEAAAMAGVPLAGTNWIPGRGTY